MSTSAKIKEARAQVADQIEELAGMMTHLREAATNAKQNPKGCAIDLEDAGALAFQISDSFQNLGKVCFDLKNAISSKE